MDTPKMKPEPEAREPANLRFLRRLVTVLTATMIGGVVLIIALIVMRFNAPDPDLPETLVLPGGTKAISFTQGPDWYAVTTDANEILIFDRITGQLRQTITID